MFRIRQPLFVAVFCIFACLPFQSVAQVRPVNDYGAIGLTQLLKRLNTTASVMMIGAHPDDEDTALLAYLARGENARTAYLSLTRGDGGQNIIGPQLGEALGVIRTEELLQARRLDGAEQYFTRAFDYGFSKTLAEAKSKWNEELILCDAVRVIRHFRPLVVVSQFSGTPADGHGQHQFAGYISPLAVKAAADRSQCSGWEEPWQVKKFYVRQRGAGEPTLRINTGKYDPLFGRSYFEIAMEARSQHKSQEQGVLELRGDQFSSLKLDGSDAKETSIFQGLDLGGEMPAVDPDNKEALLRKLVEIYPSSNRKPLVADAIAAVTGLQIDALADSEAIPAGDSFGVGVKAYVPNEAVKIKEISVFASVAPERWSVVQEELPKVNSPSFVLREVTPHSRYFRVTPGIGVWVTQPYWLVEPRDGALFRWQGSVDETMPFETRPLKARVKADVLGQEIIFERDVEYRFADDVRGEVRRNVDVVPRVTLEADQPLILVTKSDKVQKKTISFTITNHSTKEAKGVPSIAFDSASGAWGGVASTREIMLKRRGETTAFSYEITIPANAQPGRYSISGDVSIAGRSYGRAMKAAEYPHIRTHRFYRGAQVDFHVIDLKTASTKIGYVEGSGDQVFEAIGNMGFDTEMISERELATGNLLRFDAIVVGIRAYQVRPDVAANNERLLEFARQGGTLIVQYQLPAYAQQNLMPFPAQMGPRVADENAAVKVLLPAHPIFNFPNKINEDDFTGWVQERNLYNFSTMDEKYTGLLESHDGGEAENKGGLVVADLGKGKFVYCSYSFFRQLPAGVPGAYRLFANLISIPKAGDKSKEKP